MATREFILEEGTVVKYKGVPPVYLLDSYHEGGLATVCTITGGDFKLLFVPEHQPELVIPKEYC